MNSHYRKSSLWRLPGYRDQHYTEKHEWYFFTDLLAFMDTKSMKAF